MKRTILSLGVVAALAANTYGAGSVWYQATPSGGDAAVATQGAPGVATALTCNTAGSSWAIAVHYTLTDGGATSWALDHYGVNALVSAGGLTVPSAGFTAGVQNGTLDNAGGILMQGQSGQNTSGGAGPGDFIVENWTLTANVCSANVKAGIGGTEFGGNDPGEGLDFYEVVQIGSNVPRAGFSLGGGDVAGAEPVPVIVITPEPTTLSLLALGALAMIRRRK